MVQMFFVVMSSDIQIFFVRFSSDHVLSCSDVLCSVLFRSSSQMFRCSLFCSLQIMPSDVHMFFVLLSSDHALRCSDVLCSVLFRSCPQMFRCSLFCSLQIMSSSLLDSLEMRSRSFLVDLAGNFLRPISASSKLCFFQSASSSESSSKLIPLRFCLILFFT